MKTLLILFLSVSLSFAQKAEEFPFIGLSLSSQTIESQESHSEAEFKLKYGKQSLDWRTSFALSYNNNSYSSFEVTMDKILLDNLFGTPKFRPYVGAIVGYIRIDETLLKQPNYSQDGFYLGANIGLLIYATDRIDIDINYHYNSVQNLDSVDNIYGASLGLHYFF